MVLLELLTNYRFSKTNEIKLRLSALARKKAHTLNTKHEKKKTLLNDKLLQINADNAVPSLCSLIP